MHQGHFSPQNSGNPQGPSPKYGPLVQGELFAWFETGTEGFVWAVQESEKGYEGLHPLKQGDAIKITGPDGQVVFDGLIDEDRERCWQPRYEGARHGQPCVDGYWVHWIQRGVDPVTWARFFMEGGYRAELRQRQVP